MLQSELQPNANLVAFWREALASRDGSTSIEATNWNLCAVAAWAPWRSQYFADASSEWWERPIHERSSYSASVGKLFELGMQFGDAVLERDWEKARSLFQNIELEASIDAERLGASEVTP